MYVLPIGLKNACNLIHSQQTGMLFFIFLICIVESITGAPLSLPIFLLHLLPILPQAFTTLSVSMGKAYMHINSLVNFFPPHISLPSEIQLSVPGIFYSPIIQHRLMERIQLAIHFHGRGAGHSFPGGGSLVATTSRVLPALVGRLPSLSLWRELFNLSSCRDRSQSCVYLQCCVRNGVDSQNMSNTCILQERTHSSKPKRHLNHPHAAPSLPREG